MINAGMHHSPEAEFFARLQADHDAVEAIRELTDKWLRQEAKAVLDTHMGVKLPTLEVHRLRFLKVAADEIRALLPVVSEGLVKP